MKTMASFSSAGANAERTHAGSRKASRPEVWNVGTPNVELVIRSIDIHGHKYNVVSDIAQRKASERGLGVNRRTAETVGGGALLGTLVGAIAGVGTGAAVGAVAGTAGGAAVQVLTKGDRVHVPAETLLTFQLDRPIRLAGYQQSG
jgi:hypothetical protein